MTRSRDGRTADRRRTPVRRVRRPAVVVVAVLLVTTACATYVASNLGLRDQLAAGAWDRALRTASGNDRGPDRLLELLHRGHVLHYAGRYADSNTTFQQAEDLAAALYTRSVSQAALSLLVNDTTIAYRGQPFELAMVPYYRAFNYLSLGQPEAAQVEARKAVLGLAGAVEATLSELEGDADRSQLEALADNGLLHWFAGLMLESAGDLNQAFVAYRNAASAYRAQRDLLGLRLPPQLGRDLERVGRAIGFRAEVDELRASVPELFGGAGPRPSGAGEVVLLVETGWIAHRDQSVLNVPILDVDRRYGSNEAWAEQLALRAHPGWVAPASVSVDYWLTVAVPELAPAAAGPVASIRMAAGDELATSSPVDDLSRRARLTFEATRSRILVKTFARALVKYAATRAAEEEDELAGALVNLFGVLSERADTRCWLSLPDRVHMVRLPLEAGDHTVELEYLDRSGRVVVAAREEVQVPANGMVFLNRRPF